MPELTSDQIAGIRAYGMRSLVKWVERVADGSREATWRWLTSDDLLDTIDAKDERIKGLEGALTKLVNAYHGLYVAN